MRPVLLFFRGTRLRPATSHHPSHRPCALKHALGVFDQDRLVDSEYWLRCNNFARWGCAVSRSGVSVRPNRTGGGL